MSANAKTSIDLADSRPVQRTKAALFDTFLGLVLTRRYDRITVADIIGPAGIGRSTFYEHYRCKDDLLKEGLAGPFGVLADTVLAGHADDPRLEETLAHFWENRRTGNVLFAGATRTLLTRALADLLERRLATRRILSSLPPALLAAQMAGGQIALLTAWLSGLAPANPKTIADALRASARAAVLDLP